MSADSFEEAAQRRELGRLVRQLTESGQSQLDEQLVRRVKQLCRSSDRLVDAAFELALKQLRRPHAERRLSALQLLDVLFRRSHRLRQRAVADLQLIIDQCFETAGPLPAPAAAARRLTAAAAAALRYWHDTYADGYKKLAVGYRYLQQSRPGDLLPSLEEEAAARRVAEDQQRRLQRLKQAKLEQLQQEIEERRDEIVTTMTQVENCFTLLLPDVAMLDGGEEEEEEEDDEEEQEEEEGAAEPGASAESQSCDEEAGSPRYDPDWADTGVLRGHGLASARHRLVVTVPARPEPLAVTDDNAALVETLRGLMSAVRRSQLPTVQRWIQLTQTAGGGGDTLRQLSAVREALRSAVRRYDTLQLASRAAPGDGSSSDDGDMEEVPDAEDAAALVARVAGTGHGTALKPPPAAAATTTAAQCGPDSGTAAQCGPDSGTAAQCGPDSGTAAQCGPDSGTAADCGPDSGTAADCGPDPSTAADCGPDPSTAADCGPDSGSAAAGSSVTMAGPSDSGAAPDAAAAALNTAPAGGADDTAGPPPPASDATEDDNAARRARLLTRAPRLGYSADLVTWGRGSGPAAGPAPHQYETARVWRSAAEVEAPPAESADLRVTEFSGQFERVQHRCGARLPSGRLCPRADRVKCPLHGVIVARDEEGTPLSHELREKEREARVRGEDWQDPRLLAQLHATTGLDLTVRRGRRRRQPGGPGPGLTNLKSPASARQRLADKLFSGGTVRRLAAALDRLDRRRLGDKFGDQFNYQVTGR